MRILNALFVAGAAASCHLAHSQTYLAQDVEVTTLAGSGFHGYYDGTGTETMFSFPYSLAPSSSGELFVVDSWNARVRAVNQEGVVRTFAGNGSDTPYPTPPGYGTNVWIGRKPYFGAAVMDQEDTLWFVANNGAYCINSVRSDGHVTIYSELGATNLAGLGVCTNSGMCLDSANNVYFSGYSWAPSISGHRIYRYKPDGTLEIMAGSGNKGSMNGTWIFSSFNNPGALAADTVDNIYVWDSGNHVIRRIDPGRNVTSFAGNGSSTDSDGPAFSAGFKTVLSMCADTGGNLFLACGTSIRRIAADGNVTTVAGSFSESGFADGNSQTARFGNTMGICRIGTNLFVSDYSGHRIRRVSGAVLPKPVPSPNLELVTMPGLRIVGELGRQYRIESSPDMTTWTFETNIQLNTAPQLWIDSQPVSGRKYYRIIQPSH